MTGKPAIGISAKPERGSLELLDAKGDLKTWETLYKETIEEIQDNEGLTEDDKKRGRELQQDLLAEAVKMAELSERIERLSK